MLEPCQIGMDRCSPVLKGIRMADGELDLWQLADLTTPWCLRVLVTLGLASRLADSPATAAELAEAVGADADLLELVLRHLASVGVIRTDDDGRHRLVPAARGLTEGEFATFLDVDGIGGRFSGAWATLPEVVRTGRPAYEQMFGLPFWEDLAAHPDLGAQFDAMMGEGHQVEDPNVLPGGDLNDATTIVDVGGGTGTLLKAVLQAFPHLHGILVDLPPTVDRAVPGISAAGLTDRISLARQSFFDPLPPDADVYLVSGIVNDWPDDETVAILTRCREAVRDGGAVVVLGGVSPDSDGPPAGLSPETVLVGGRRRTMQAFTELARRAGLVVVAEAPSSFRGYAVQLRPDLGSPASAAAVTPSG
jgi:2,7-dihydroxy-5-methyl-1-naphthoate 7-O-methyltransferase